jgi:hypothetical protein
MYKAGFFPFLKKHMQNIFRYYESIVTQGESNTEMEEVLAYLRKDPFPLLPYEFTRDYQNRNVPIYRDRAACMFYVVDKDMKLYFKRSMSKEEVRNRFNALAAEQDMRSPHRYLSHEQYMIGTIIGDDVMPTCGDDFFIYSDDVVADVGTAEGNFAISIVNNVNNLVLFEYDSEWIRALEQTFKPYSNKTDIVNKMVSGRISENTTTLDDYFKDKQVDFIKTDIEGSELEALAGMQKVLKDSERLKVAISVYHKHEHTEQIRNILTNFDTSLTYGYMHPWTILREKPYLVKGVLRGVKN